MEPRRDDGDDAWRASGRPSEAWSAAMEPRRDDGDDDIAAYNRTPGDSAAMEPRRDDGDDPHRCARWASRTAGRNGAPS